MSSGVTQLWTVFAVVCCRNPVVVRLALCRLWGYKNRPAVYYKKVTKPCSVCLIGFFYCVVYYGPVVLLLFVGILCPLVVLVKLSVLVKWLARKTPLRKPNRGEWIISIKRRPKSVCDFHGSVNCFIVLCCIFLSPPPALCDTFHTSTAWYSLFVLTVLLKDLVTN